MSISEPTFSEARQACRDALGLDDINEFITSFGRTWQLLLPNTPLPHGRQIALWLGLHTPARLYKALLKTSAKSDKVEAEGKVFDTDYATRFLSSVANAAKTEQQENPMTPKQAETTATEVLETQKPSANNWPKLPTYAKAEPVAAPQKPLTPDFYPEAK